MSLEALLARSLAEQVRRGDPFGAALAALRLARVRRAAGKPGACALLRSALTRIAGLGADHLEAKVLLAGAELACGTFAQRTAALERARDLWQGHPPGQFAVAKAEAHLRAEGDDWAGVRTACAAARVALEQVGATAARPSETGPGDRLDTDVAWQAGRRVRELVLLDAAAAESMGDRAAAAETLLPVLPGNAPADDLGLSALAHYRALAPREAGVTALDQAARAAWDETAPHGALQVMVWKLADDRHAATPRRALERLLRGDTVRWPHALRAAANAELGLAALLRGDRSEAEQRLAIARAFDETEVDSVRELTRALSDEA